MSQAQRKTVMQRQENLPSMMIPIQQREAHFSGPATAEAVLRFWKLAPMRLGFTSEDEFQRFLAQDEYMATNLNGGTEPDDWIRTVNHILQSYDLNDRRQYSRIELASGYSNAQEFYDVVRRSLVKNVPVALAIVSPSQDEFGSYGVNYDYILIAGTTGMADNAVFTYLDTSDGVLRQFDKTFLAMLSGGNANQPGTLSSFIIAYLDPSDQIFIDSIDNNAKQTQGSARCSFLTKLTSICQNLDRNKRGTFRVSTCQAVDATNPLTNYADHLYVMHKLIGHNGIQMKLSRSTAMTLERFYMENDRSTFMNYAVALLARIVQKGTVLDADRLHAAQTLFDGMPYIHDKILTVLREDDMRPLFVQTYRSYNFHETIKSIGLDNAVYINDLPKA